MADPVSILYLVLSVVSTTRQVTEFVQAIRNIDQKVDQQYYRLVAEREITEAWANQIRLTADGDLRSAIPTDKYDEVQKLLEKLKSYYARADQKYSKIFTQSRDSEGKPVSTLAARTKYVLAGHEDLKDLVDVIKSMNKALRAIAPPLPPYVGQMYAGGIGPLARTDQVADRRIDLSMAPRNLDTASVGSSILRESIITSSTSTQSSTLVDTRRGQQTSPPFTDSIYPRQTLADPSVDILIDHNLRLPSLAYNLCLDAIGALASGWNSKHLQNTHSRLRLWGAGLFEAPATLNEVLSTNINESNVVRRALISIMANILVLAERDLYRLSQTLDDIVQRKVMDLSTEVSSMLGTDELVEYSLQRWAQIMQEKSLTAQHGARKEYIKHFEQQRITKSSRLVVDSWPEEHDLDVNSLSRTVELLFDLLPAIRMQRRQYVCELPAIEKADGKETVQPSTTLTGSTEEADESIVDNLNKIESFIRKQDERAVQQGRGEGVYVSPFRKQRMRLEELQALAAKNNTRVPKMDVDSEDLIAKKEEMRKTIAKLVTEINRIGPSKTPTKSFKKDELDVDKKSSGKAIDTGDQRNDSDLKKHIAAPVDRTEDSLALDILDALRRTAV